MPDYNLNALDRRSFEQIVQAIAKKEIASGVTLFGDGPKGGRMATFNFCTYNMASIFERPQSQVLSCGLRHPGRIVRQKNA
jgi:hypothetical protein